MKTVILAGGLGTRMGKSDTPKPLLEVYGRPILYRILDRLSEVGFTDVLILTSHGADKIEDAIGDGQDFGLHVEYRRDDPPRGAAGAVLAAEELLLDDDFLMIYGDLVFDIDLRELVRQHRKNDADATLVVHPNDHPFDSDLVAVDGGSRISRIFNRPHSEPRIGEFLPCRNLAASAIAVISPRVLNLIPYGEPSDFGRHIYWNILKTCSRLFAYQTADYILDVGTPRRLEKAAKALELDDVRRRPRPAVFLDRDGVINESTSDTGFVNSPDEFRLVADTGAAIKMLRHAGYRIVVVTNQGGIELGFLTESKLNQIHVRMDSELAFYGTYVDRVYVCPHYHSSGDCGCRKPKPGMIFRAAEELNLDLSRSILVGDRTSDLETARRARIKSYLVRTGSAGQDGEFILDPVATGDNLYQVAKFITGSKGIAA